MIYELRTYWAAPGKLASLLERFRSLTLQVFKRHHIDVVAFWTPVPPTPENGDLVYILRFPDENALNTAWDAFRADPEWTAGKAASEKGGTLVTKLTSVILQPTDFSPLK